MKTKSMLLNSIMRVVLVTAGLLLVPLLGQWPWSMSDFIIMGILISFTGFMIELARHTLHDNTKRIVIIGTIVFAFLYLWAELAVGIFTNWGS